MKTFLSNYLRFTRAERNGTVALFILAALLFALPEITRQMRPPRHTDFQVFQTEIQAFLAGINHVGARDSVPELFDFDPNTASQDDFMRLGLPEKVALGICHYREKGGAFRQATDFQKIWGLDTADYKRLLPYIHVGGQKEKQLAKPTATLFAFDPNTASEADLLRLGLPARTVNSILHYREKGGQFRKKEDLQKIYTLEEADFARVAPYAVFPEQQPTAKSFFPNQGKAKSTSITVDINKAGAEDWMQLPGIGEGRARQLVNFREKLGGFLSVDQIGEMYNMPDSVFQKIRPQLTGGGGEIRKIRLNTATAADLDVHPYISKRQAELIVAYREQHGPYQSIDDLSKIRAFTDPAWLSRIRPYLGLE